MIPTVAVTISTPKMTAMTATMIAITKTKSLEQPVRPHLQVGSANKVCIL